MQNPIQKFRQSSSAFEKPGILSKKLKTLASSSHHKVQYFLLKLRTSSLLTNVYKRDLELSAKIKKICFLDGRFSHFY